MAKKKDTSLTRVFLERMRNGDVDYVDTLTDEQIKGIQPYTLLMWINGAYGDPDDVKLLKIRTVNFSSGLIFSLDKNRRVVLKMLIALHSNLNISGYRFVKPNIGARKEDKELQAICYIHNCTMREAKLLYNTTPKDAIEEVMEILEDV